MSADPRPGIAAALAVAGITVCPYGAPNSDPCVLLTVDGYDPDTPGRQLLRLTAYLLGAPITDLDPYLDLTDLLLATTDAIRGARLATITGTTPVTWAPPAAGSTPRAAILMTLGAVAPRA